MMRPIGTMQLTEDTTKWHTETTAERTIATRVDIDRALDRGSFHYVDTLGALRASFASLGRSTQNFLHLGSEELSAALEGLSTTLSNEKENWKGVTVLKESEEYELEDIFEYDIARSASPIKKETIRVRIRNVKEAPPLERSP